MAETTEVIVVGGGVQGASLAFHLARAGMSPTLFDRPGVSNATGRSSGLVRMHYDLPENVQLAWRSHAYFSNWTDMVGGHCGFVRTGFLQLVPPELNDPLRANVALQQELGVPTLLVTADDVRRLAPQMMTDDVELAAYEPESGYADPSSTAGSFIAAARERGAQVRTTRRVLELLADGDRVIGVRTEQGDVHAPIVVLAAGAWSAQLARGIGLDLPIRAWIHDTAYIARPDGFGTFPTFIDFGRAMYVRPEGTHLVLVGLEDGNPVVDTPDQALRGSPDFTERAVDRVTQRLPGLAEGGLQSANFGVDGITSDQQPIIGPVAPNGPEGLWLDCGFSGTGFKTSPAVGEALARVITDGVDASPELKVFGWDRFCGPRRISPPHPYPPIWH
ncbi:MAG TPA: FAD-binding oxidoreductase [Candidatus Limnocylindria bacterium]